MLFTITRIEISTGKEMIYKNMSETDMKDLIQRYTYNGLFYERKNGKYIYTVEGE